MPGSPPRSVLAGLVARGTRPGDLLPELHRELLANTAGSRSIVLERRADDYLATSGRGFSDLGEGITGNEALELTARAADDPTILDLAGFPTLRRMLDASRALIVPVANVRVPALLAVGDASPEDQVLATAAIASVEFGLVFEWNRLARERSFHERLREFSVAFWRSLASPSSGQIALESLTSDVNRLLGSSAVSIWLHDRRARELALTASSDPIRHATPSRISVDDHSHPAARGLRLDRPQVLATTGPVTAAPLRGWRRALGAVVIEGRQHAAEEEAASLALVQELARQLSVAIENLQLLDEILKQRRLLEDTFHSLVDLVVVTDGALRIAQSNAAFAARVHSTRADLLDRRLDDLVGLEMSTWIRGDDVDEADKSGSARTRTFDSPALGGTFVVTVTPLVSHDGEPAGRVLVARDITAQIRLEAEREALRARLAQTEKLAALGQFVAGIAHEINNPLQGVLGHLELLVDTNVAARPVRGELRRIYHDADRAARIVQDLLVFTGARRLTRRRLKIDRVLSRALASRRAALAQRHITVVREHAEDLPAIVGDPLLLQQAFLNVLINAEHAIADTGPTGTIHVATRLSDDRDRIVTTIRDSGPGIAPDILARVFDPFFTTKEVGHGTGLGLAITYGILQEHRGAIVAGNAPGGGAVVTLELPVARAVEGV